MKFTETLQKWACLDYSSFQNYLYYVNSSMTRRKLTKTGLLLFATKIKLSNVFIVIKLILDRRSQRIMVGG